MGEGTVEVRLFAAARAAVGCDVVHAEPGTLASVAAQLVGDHPALAEVLPRCSYLLDEVAVHGEPAGVPIPPGSQLDVLPPFAGG